MEFTDVVRKRRMVHVFEDRPVDAELIDRLLDVARRGPSAGFSQGTDFLVLDDPETLARFWELVEDPRFPRENGELDVAPPVLVVALADPGRYLERYSRPDKIAFSLDRADAWPVKFWDTDTAMACMLLLLAAVDAGLGGWYFGIPYGEAELRREFGIPDDRNVIGVVGIGYAGIDERPQGSAYSLSRRPLDDIATATAGDEPLTRKTSPTVRVSKRPHRASTLPAGVRPDAGAFGRHPFTPRAAGRGGRGHRTAPPNASPRPANTRTDRHLRERGCGSDSASRRGEMGVGAPNGGVGSRCACAGTGRRLRRAAVRARRDGRSPTTAGA